MLGLRMKNNEACIGVLGIQDICHFTSRDIGGSRWGIMIR